MINHYVMKQQNMIKKTHKINADDLKLKQNKTE